ncbi:Tetratricopeptide TPR_2 repeat-containing protein [Flexistipes sinusarabici DSM 4947]|uniref:Tetratricopeptide TPR_2 repeat-containing protein n=1 Tax=Flexistipes sinusarabici (strain ATCC 49648 / DSM 4947 / MAS 10) TaxID=717231 RepID=F8E3W2_FLESM|nr:hypothetical protein [Flexistipes sinusarabici]AEI15464.1 Tetratricopeptide TPR_2 repeat-containing protein [Flexistipes sinusarabici DSM 4947]
MDEATRSKYQKDVEYFSGKLKENPSSKVFMPLSLAYLKLEQYDKVIEVCSLGLDMHPEYISAKTILAQAYLGKGMIEEAKPLLHEVAEVNKDNYRAYKLLGDIYRAEEDTGKAFYYYRTALESSPEDIQLRTLTNELAERIDAGPFEYTSRTEKTEKVAETADEEMAAESEERPYYAESEEKISAGSISEDEGVERTEEAEFTDLPGDHEFEPEEIIPDELEKEQKEEIVLDDVFFSNDDISEILEGSEKGAYEDEDTSGSDVSGTSDEKESEQTDFGAWEGMQDISGGLGEFFGDDESESEDVSEEAGKQIERLEKWLDNVRKVKEKRDV